MMIVKGFETSTSNDSQRVPIDARVRFKAYLRRWMNDVLRLMSSCLRPLYLH